MNKWIYRFCFFIIFIFAFIGATFLSIVAHELSHRQDLEQHITKDGEMCFFAFPSNMSTKEILFGDYAVGYVLYNYNKNVTQETKDNIDWYTEKKATIVGIIILIIFAVCFLIEMFRRIKNSEAEEFYEFFNKWLTKNGYI